MVEGRLPNWSLVIKSIKSVMLCMAACGLSSKWETRLRGPAEVGIVVFVVTARARVGFFLPGRAGKPLLHEETGHSVG